MEAKIFPGSKFFRYAEDNEIEIIRIYSGPEKSKKENIYYIDSNGSKKQMSLDYLIANYKLLRYDGMIIFSIVYNGSTPDVIVGLSSFEHQYEEPYAICRQAVYDVYANNIKKSQDVLYIGVSMSQDTCPVNIKLTDLMKCTKLTYSKPVAVYLDDTLDDILKLFSNKKFDNALVKFKECVTENPTQVAGDGFKGIILGTCSTLKELLTNNNFMYDFRKCFHIEEVPFHIDEESEALSIENILYLENELKVNIMETYLIRYTKEINLKTIKRKYLLISSAADKFDKVYIVGYDIADGQYIPRTTISNSI